MAAVLNNVNTKAICEAAGAFVSGEVKDQSLRFAPSVPEFVHEAKRRHAAMEYEARPKIEAPAPKPEGPRVSSDKMQALKDAVAGKRTIESVADEYGIKLPQ